jgi:hypothetical protein
MFWFEVKNIFSNHWAFAALTEEGFIESWGVYGGSAPASLDDKKVMFVKF